MFSRSKFVLFTRDWMNAQRWNIARGMFFLTRHRLTLFFSFGLKNSAKIDPNLIANLILQLLPVSLLKLCKFAQPLCTFLFLGLWLESTFSAQCTQEFPSKMVTVNSCSQFASKLDTFPHWPSGRYRWLCRCLPSMLKTPQAEFFPVSVMVTARVVTLCRWKLGQTSENSDVLCFEHKIVLLPPLGTDYVPKTLWSRCRLHPKWNTSWNTNILEHLQFRANFKPRTQMENVSGKGNQICPVSGNWEFNRQKIPPLLRFILMERDVSQPMDHTAQLSLDARAMHTDWSTLMQCSSMKALFLSSSRSENNGGVGAKELISQSKIKLFSSR